MPNAFQLAASRLGLVLTPPDAGYFSQLEMSGSYQGHVVRISRSPMMRRLATDVYFQVPLDLGLHVAPAGQAEFTAASVRALRRIGKVLARLRHEDDLHVGDRELDDRFDVHGDEEARVAPLLEAARAPLLAWHKAAVAFAVDDTHLDLRRYSTLTTGDTADTIAADVDAALGLARAFEAVRATLPAAAVLAPHVEAFRALAQSYPLDVSETPLAAWGSVGPYPLSARALRVGHGSFDLEVGLEHVGAPFAGTLHASGPKAAGVSFEEAFSFAETAAGEIPRQARDALMELARACSDVAVGPHGLHLVAPLAVNGATRAFPLAQAIGDAAAALRALHAT